MTYNYTKNNLYSRFKQAKLLTKRKVVFGSKLKPKKSLKRSTVRDKDIAHFTSFVLHKNTRVIFFIIFVICIHNSYSSQDMAWGTKIVNFTTGEKVKVGNVVLEATKSGIIRDYVKTTKVENEQSTPDDRIRVFKKRTYLRWLQVY